MDEIAKSLDFCIANRDNWTIKVDVLVKLDGVDTLDERSNSERQNKTVKRSDAAIEILMVYSVLC